MDLKSQVRNVPDFPKPGILYRDLSPLIKNPYIWKCVVNEMADVCRILKPDIIIGIESRGFIIGSSLSTTIETGFVPVRKKGKIPGEVIQANYDLEYGSDTLEVGKNTINKGEKVYIVDDVLATGGTASTAANLVNEAGGKLLGFGFIVELTELKGRSKLSQNVRIDSVIKY